MFQKSRSNLTTSTEAGVRPGCHLSPAVKSREGTPHSCRSQLQSHCALVLALFSHRSKSKHRSTIAVLEPRGFQAPHHFTRRSIGVEPCLPTSTYHTRQRPWTTCTHMGYTKNRHELPSTAHTSWTGVCDQSSPEKVSCCPVWSYPCLQAKSLGGTYPQDPIRSISQHGLIISVNNAVDLHVFNLSFCSRPPSPTSLRI